MRNAYILAALCVCLFLSGCGGRSGEKEFESFSTDVRESEELNFTAAVRAETENSTVRFVLAYKGQGENCAISVIEPELLSGVTLRYEKGKALLDCAGTVVDTGELCEGVTPAGALPLIVSAMGSGHLDCVSKEGGETVFRIIPKDGIAVDVWVDESGTPTHAELIAEGRTVLFCDISDWR